MTTTNTVLLLLLSHKLYFYIIIAILGLAVGSFCNVVIYRLPIMLHDSWHKECLSFLKQESTTIAKIFNLFVPRSHCPKCQQKVPAWHNIPLLSYLILRGKCHQCNKTISWRYPLVEILSCILSLIIAYRFGPSWQTAAIMVLTWALLILVFIDFSHQLLPDSITLGILWLGLLVNTFHLFTTPEQAILGAIFGYGSLWIVAKTFKLIRKQEGMGHGDFKLLALFGAWLGWEFLPAIILLSSLIGIVVGIALIVSRKHKYSSPMPFGPYLAIAGWIMFFCGQNIFSWYRILLLNS